MPKPWEKQPEETSKAFEAFRLYRDYGAGRSLRKVAEKHFEGSAGKLGWIETWSSKYGWVARCEAWDAHQDDIRRQAREDAIRSAEKELADELLDLVRTQIGLAKGADGSRVQLDALVDLLDRAGLKPIEKTETTHKTDGNAAAEVLSLLGLSSGGDE